MTSPQPYPYDTGANDDTERHDGWGADVGASELIGTRGHRSRWFCRVAVAATAALAATVAAVAPAMAAESSADLAVDQASVAGGATSAEAGDSLTFVFGAKNLGPDAGDVSINQVNVRGLTVDSLECVPRSGLVIQPDGPDCETGIAAAGQSGGHLVLTGTVTGTSTVVVVVCVSSLNGSIDPNRANNCRTLHVRLL
jgi:hypothetical protein